MRIKPTDDHVSIVLLGAFNPRIITPGWLALKGLIPIEAAESAAVNIIYHDISIFSAGNMAFQIELNRFVVQCPAIYKEMIRDLILSTFQEHLKETPIWTMGINRKVTFSCGTEAIRDHLGKLLAPRAPWGDWGKEIDSVDRRFREHRGLIRLVMRQEPRPDQSKGYIQADIQPSQTNSSMVIIDVNNHFEIGSQDQVKGAAPATEILNAYWQSAIEFAADITDQIMATVQSIK